LPAWLRITSCRSGRWQKASTVMTSPCRLTDLTRALKAWRWVTCSMVQAYLEGLYAVS
jgi:hypothetical protein